jgi:hypothetical protein
MENRSKGRTRTQAGLSDAARPDERLGDDREPLAELDVEDDDEPRRAAPSGDDAQAPLLAEGEPVGPWSDEEDEETAFDAASGSDSEEEEVEDDDAAKTAPGVADEANQARFADDEGDDGYQAPAPHPRDRRRGR